MACITGKIAYDSMEIAGEALVQNHVRNAHRAGAGPINIYQCQDCGKWHFTSQGARYHLLQDPEVIDRIRREQMANHWEKKLR
jgi:hypothetical protein